MTRRLIASYSIFNTQDLIYESLTSVARACDEVRIYDARYLDFKCSLCGKEHDNSCDNTMKEVEAFERDNPSIQVKVERWPAMGEMAKRTKMMQDCPEDSCVLVIDDDELFFGHAVPLWQFCGAPPAKFAYIDFLFAGAGHGSGVPIPLARLFIRTPGLRYVSYYHIEDAQGLVVDMKSDNLLVPYGRRASGRTYLHPSARLVELDKGYRSKKRDTDRAGYNQVMTKREWGDGPAKESQTLATT